MDFVRFCNKPLETLGGWATATWEAAGPKHTDAPSEPVERAVDRAVTEHRYRSLVAALDAVDRQFRSDGQPPRFEPLAKD